MTLRKLSLLLKSFKFLLYSTEIFNFFIGVQKALKVLESFSRDIFDAIRLKSRYSAKLNLNKILHWCLWLWRALESSDLLLYSTKRCHFPMEAQSFLSSSKHTGNAISCFWLNKAESEEVHLRKLSIIQTLFSRKYKSWLPTLHKKVFSRWKNNSLL